MDIQGRMQGEAWGHVPPLDPGYTKKLLSFTPSTIKLL